MEEHLEDLKGHAKEVTGRAIGNDDLEREGKADRLAANVKEKLGDAKDWIEEKIDAVHDKNRH